MTDYSLACTSFGFQGSDSDVDLWHSEEGIRLVVNGKDFKVTIELTDLSEYERNTLYQKFDSATARVFINKGSKFAAQLKSI